MATPSNPFENLGNPNISDSNNPNVNPSLNSGVDATANLDISPANITVPGNFTNSRSALGSALPEHGVWGHPYSRMEPLITPEQARNRFLFGVPRIFKSERFSYREKGRNN
ncbi:MAG: hypothetical protein KGO96_07275 [Elusimicrobia bacterium]|nr:hypothetical protein [Elusimicrobiota bacterium]